MCSEARSKRSRSATRSTRRKTAHDSAWWLRAVRSRVYARQLGRDGESVSRGRCSAASAPNRSRGRSFDSAQTAIARRAETNRRAAVRDRRKARLARIADRDQHVSHEPIAPDPLDGRAAEHLAEGCIVERRQFLQKRQHQLDPWMERDLLRGLREFVPGTNREAVIAAVDTIADRLAKFARDVSLGSIVGTRSAPRVYLIGTGEARVVQMSNTRCISSMVGRRASGSSEREVNMEGGKPRSAFRANICVLALPADPDCAGRLLHYRRGVDEYLTSPPNSPRPACEPFPPPLSTSGIAANRVDRDHAALASLQPARVPGDAYSRPADDRPFARHRSRPAAAPAVVGIQPSP